MRPADPLRADVRGGGAVEFALVAPVLILFVIGIAQLGTLFFASADMRNAVASGARLASIYPRPKDETVIARINAHIVDLEPRYVVGPTIVHDTDADDNAYAEIRMSYAVPVDFLFFETPPVTLTEVRRVFTQPPAAS